MVLLPVSAYKNFRRYGIRHQYRACCAELPGYGRFVSLLPRLLLHSFRSRKTGSYLADSIKLAVCCNGVFLDLNPRACYTHKRASSQEPS